MRVRKTMVAGSEAPSYRTAPVGMVDVAATLWELAAERMERLDIERSRL